MTVFKTCFAVVLLGLSALSWGNIKTDMYAMKRQMNALFNAETSEQFHEAATAFIADSERAKTAVPSDLNETEKADYQQGMQAVIDVVKNANTLATQGKLAEAKTAIEPLLDLKKTYHQKYK